jgi:hypothetical protein
VFQFLRVIASDATARTLRAQIIIDGVIALEGTTGSIATAGAGVQLIGQVGGASNNPVPAMEIIPFNQSFELKVASSLTETDRFDILHKYYTT